MRRRTFLGVAAGTTVATAVVPTLTARPAWAATVPQTIPALREWTTGAVSFTHRSDSRVVVDSVHSGPLAATAAVFADDLRALTGHQPTVAVGSRSDARAGDVYLTLNPADVPSNAQGYRLEVTDVVAIAALTAAGVFYGTRSVLQLLVQSTTIAGGVAKDWPVYPERGAHIDTGSRRYSRAWWRNLLRDMSFVKLNQISVMVGGKGLSDAEKAEVTSFGQKYHIEIVPLLSMPNHTSYTATAEHPELRLETTAQPAADSMDFTKPGALAVIREWIERDIDKYSG